MAGFFASRRVTLVDWTGQRRYPNKSVPQTVAARLVAEHKAEVLTLGPMHILSIQMNPCYEWPEKTSQAVLEFK